MALRAPGRGALRWLPLLLCLAATRVAAQPLTFRTVPWDIVAADAELRLRYLGASRDAGYRVPTDVPRAASHRYVWRNDGTLLWTYTLDGRLSGITLRQKLVDAEQARLRFAALRDSLEWYLGEPDSADDESVAWERSGTRLKVSAGRVEWGDEIGDYVWISHQGPRFDEYVRLVTTERANGSPDHSDPEMSNRWFVIYSDPRVRIAGDTSMTEQEAETFQLWVRTDFSSIQKEETPRGAVELDSALRLQEYDCRGRRIRTRDATFWLDGKEVLSFGSSPSSWSAIEPATIGDAMLRAVCRRARGR